MFSRDEAISEEVDMVTAQAGMLPETIIYLTLPLFGRMSAARRWHPCSAPYAHALFSEVMVSTDSKMVEDVREGWEIPLT